jgi:hypothetical protein
LSLPLTACNPGSLLAGKFALAVSRSVGVERSIGAYQGQGRGGALYLAQISVSTLTQNTIARNRATTPGNDIHNLGQ